MTVAGFSTVNAQPAKPASPFGTKSYGEGGGYKHPDAAVGDFFETKPDAAPAKPGKLPTPAKITPEIQTSEAAPSRPRPRPFAAAVAKAEAAPAKNSKLEAVSLAAKTPASAHASAAAVEGGSPDSASDDARRDYEARMFGAPAAPRRQGLADAARIAAPEPATAASTGEGMLFVSLELDAKEAGSLRDAVAGLGAAAAFRPDARFQPLPGEGGSVRISGWVPASRLGDAISRPGVRRVSVERGGRPAGDDRVGGAYLLTLRVTDPARPEESIARSAMELTAATGFKLDRVFGFETVPGGGATALVSGTMPVSQLSRALALSSVIKISAADSIEPAAEAAKPAPREGFFKFVMARSLWLVLLTLLLALPVIGETVKKGLAVFVPYR